MTHGKTGTELTIWFQKIDVVATDVILCETNDSSCQTDFSVVVCGLFRYVTSQLRDLDLLGDALFEASK